MHLNAWLCKRIPTRQQGCPWKPSPRAAGLSSPTWGDLPHRDDLLTALAIGAHEESAAAMEEVDRSAGAAGASAGTRLLAVAAKSIGPAPIPRGPARAGSIRPATHSATPVKQS